MSFIKKQKKKYLGQIVFLFNVPLSLQQKNFVGFSPAENKTTWTSLIFNFVYSLLYLTPQSILEYLIRRSAELSPTKKKKCDQKWFVHDGRSWFDENVLNFCAMPYSTAQTADCLTQESPYTNHSCVSWWSIRTSECVKGWITILDVSIISVIIINSADIVHKPSSFSWIFTLVNVPSQNRIAIRSVSYTNMDAWINTNTYGWWRDVLKNMFP